jgi:hypothetical protein
MSSLAALDRSDPQAYVGPAYEAINPHPAKSQGRKARVLASSATPEFRAARRTLRPPSCLKVSSAVVLFADQAFDGREAVPALSAAKGRRRQRRRSAGVWRYGAEQRLKELTRRTHHDCDQHYPTTQRAGS